MKKGSKEAKAWGRKMKRLRSPTRKRKKSNSATKLKYRTMAKRRYVRKTKRRTTKRSMSFMGINLNTALASMGYGAIRARTSQMLAPYTQKLPLGNIADEVGMIVASWAGKKYLFKGSGIARDALSAGQKIEMARIGDAVASGNVGIPFLGMAGATPTSNTNIF